MGRIDYVIRNIEADDDDDFFEPKVFISILY